MIKRSVISLLAVFFLLGGVLYAEMPSMTMGSWSFIKGNVVREKGVYGFIGITQGISSRFEVSTFTLAMVTPDCCSELYQGAGLGVSLLYPRSAAHPDAPSYISIYSDAGLLFGLHDINDRDGEPFSKSVSLYLRFTPLSVGNIYYGSREKIASFGLLYTWPDNQFGFFWNPLIYDRYL